ncbi:glycoside hydrolase family 57 protein [Synechococcus sp. RedBA-s]|uniref:glycoside hydrolase family 57 protein n=1 Tax=Synechococcus sp. RedBA-s TaxID=2823741 RepID=UPI0020CBCA71|nr:1,4-alpha-glucan branching protein domain-containing protein [Synechococcus sp. RedBA-s]MCP9799844.1 DUF1957 domain-containing protein [Synechococcus sp. RedBA-s]
MATGTLALVLHAHLPFVRNSQPGSLEEDWYFQALLESYLPLLQMLEASRNDPSQRPRLSLGLSPTLLSLINDPVLSAHFPHWLAQRQHLLAAAPSSHRAAATALADTLESTRRSWIESGGQLLQRFRQLQQDGVLDLLTCAATHGYLPLLRHSPEAVRAQLINAVREHQRLLGARPLGIWLPECAYYEGLDQLLRQCGLRYAVLDAHGLLHALPRPRYGVYAPICSPAGIAFFARDGAATLPVWSASEGYPGDGSYREFHRDLGWDLPEAKLQAQGITSSRPLGLKLHRVSSQDSPLDQKLPYEPEAAARRTAEHASAYLAGRRQELSELAVAMARPPLLVAPFDAELFGHWWYEGPLFLAELFRQGPGAGVAFSSLRGALERQESLQICRPSPSSWGQGGYHHYWLHQSNAWVVPEWHRASAAMVKRVNGGVASERQRRLLTQAGRELLLAQSSDWSFILRAGTTTGLARERIHRHLDRFWRLMHAIDTGAALADGWLEAIEAEDCLLPQLNAADWASVKTQQPPPPTDERPHIHA